jgi:proline racemase
MRFRRMFSTIDTHTCGDPTRTVIGGMPPIPGDTIAAKMLYLKEHRDDIRQVLMFEPRGNEVQSGVILTDPCTPGTDIGVIYIEVGGYLFMCGHDTIGVATALIESGMVTPREPFTHISLDTPAGVVKVKVRVEGNVAREVTFTNAPAFVFARDVEIEVPPIGPVTADVAWGGLYYAIVEARDVGLTLCAAERRSILRTGVKVREAVNARIKVSHPQKPFVDQVTHVLFSAPTDNPAASMQNAVVIAPGSVCRSPCGTGTCAKLAQLYARGELALNQPFGHESATTRTVFTAHVLEETFVGDFPAVVTDVTGSAYVTGMHTFVVDPDDPLQKGFSFL